MPWNNRYTDYFASDNALCLPVLTQEQIAAVMFRMQQIAEGLEGEGPQPKLSLDLEHLQVADYATFRPMTEQQQETIRKLVRAEPIRTEDMAYLALRSLIGLHWDTPTSESDVRRAAAYDKALEITLTEFSAFAASKLRRPDALLPYWGRLGFLRVMATIPEERIDAQQLHRFACVLLKDPAFNARSFRYDDYGLIGLNFALEPILKSLNRMLLHFFHTSDIAGPRRLERAWASLAPIAAYFWSRWDVEAQRLSPMHLLFDEAMVFNAHSMTASQVDFIIRHELGHLVMDHAKRLRGLPDNAASKALRHEFEYAADVFAQGSVRSALYSRLRVDSQSGQEHAVAANVDGGPLEALQDHQREVSAVRLLFAYMEVVDQVGQLLKRRLGSTIAIREQMNSHPSARERLARLEVAHIGEHQPTSQVLRYADTFFADVLRYADSLDDAALAESLRDLY